MPKSALDLVRQYEQIFDAADSERRDLTASERRQVNDLVERAGEQKQLEDKMNEFGLALGSPGSAFTDPSRNSTSGGPGDVFIRSDGYKSILSDRPQTWSTGPVEVMGPLQLKGTLSEGVGGAGPGGGLTRPSWQPGIVSKLLEPLGVGDLFGQSQTAASQVRYIVEGTATNAAAGVAELGTKPESTLGFTETTERSRRSRRSCRYPTSSWRTRRRSSPI
jgi:hypothetical protein